MTDNIINQMIPIGLMVLYSSIDDDNDIETPHKVGAYLFIL